MILEGGIEANTQWTKLWISDREVIGLYHALGECEQFHSKIKTDMDPDRLPSGRFETNELVLELAVLTYNILRMIGQESISRRGTATKHKVRRRRLRTVIGNMILIAGHITEHTRQMLLCLVAALGGQFIKSKQIQLWIGIIKQPTSQLQV